MVKGDLTMHGVTSPVTLEVNIVNIGNNPRTRVASIGFDISTRLKRSDFGLGEYVPQVGDEIQIHITSEAAESAAYAAYLKLVADAEAAKPNKK
jgi:polyisoprenoid-binding protein YceI